MLSAASIARSRALLAPSLLPSSASSVNQARHASARSSAKSSLQKLRTKERREKEARSGGKQEDDKKKKSPRGDPGTNFIFRALPAKQLIADSISTSSIPSQLGLPLFEPSQLSSEDAGKAFALPYPEHDACRQFGVPRNVLLDFRILARPATVIRDITVEMFAKMQEARRESSDKHSYVLYGEPGSGKSYTLLQCVEWAFSSDWLVLYVPRGISLVNSSTPFAYDIRTRTYTQASFAAQTLQRFLAVNERILSIMRLKETIYLDERTKIPRGSLADFIKRSLLHPTLAPAALEALLGELGKQDKYPVLLAVDDFQALFCTSTYRDPKFQGIKAWHMSMPRLLLEYFSGMKVLKRGVVLGATSTSSTQFKLSPELRYALGIQPELGAPPFRHIAPEIQEYTSIAQPVEVPSQFSVDEAASAFEIWNQNRTLHTHINDDLFLSKYAETGGNPREFVWRGLLGTLQT